ncbi:MAG: diaminopimelate decarboxylase [Actinobacteria bacterium BACL2 MAG-121001-bin67]|jgi:diaminopimelate decarboxylase|uniref:Diaminopimelate decarboxylase n=3 Tax=ac1 cluster TaxID=1655545 RepID=A0A0R2P570_9ACTN|nr:MAG: diaminopimelate decarboxylase [Actinobacteria bacterium BACL2 MAG-121001-bin67]KRO54026.1 MAG: diaminopimelate decarboxylase [Actinobacteria bacterium BACL2 MAG-120820-bin50]KRO60603.1 MAG: diaminopimelate decarboxylase [Pelagibacteraceae bacterium BACL5 MAG-120705-bin12]KRO73126.1 MAG: diaminopimelate decarboxylase [Actinobacteria bacterium BACL2 MAG-120920-bin34]KRP31286.1 MAG: diaminopimelate decarboxylase [Actinobacteria bacterium BACL2 MAG-120507-bin38]MDP4931358.1 diaminopimelate
MSPIDSINTPQGQIISLFPSGTSLSESNELLIGGCLASELVSTFGTPALIIDEAALRDRARRYQDGLRSRWPNSEVIWASKSLPLTSVFRLLGQEGLGIDVAGGGELVMALAAGISPSKILVHGNAKTDDELEMAVKAGVGTIVIDNFDDIDRLERIVKGEQAVLVRIIPGVLPDTHLANATGQDDSKFGLSISDARVAIERLKASKKLRLDGLHLHLGSQIMSTQPFIQSIEAIASLGEFSVYDLGGGLGVRYTYKDSPPSIEEYLDALIATARKYLPSTAKILIEPGRSMVADAAVTLYRVVTIKRSLRTFVAIDGGMADNLEVSLYGQRFEATVANRVGGGELYSLVGRHCESGDILIDGVRLQDPKVGDIIAVPVTGAYCLTMANNYNGARRPPVVFCLDGLARAVVRRETYEDLLSRDLN